MTHVLLLLISLGLSVRAEIRLRGIGANEPSDVYQRWLASYAEYRYKTTGVMVDVGYEGMNSVLGRCVIEGGCVASVPMSFAGSNIVLHQNHGENHIEELPIMAWSLSIAYNLPNITQLRLSPSAISGMIRSEVNFWNDDRLVVDNPPLRFYGNTPITFVFEQNQPVVLAATHDLMQRMDRIHCNSSKQEDDPFLVDGKVELILQHLSANAKFTRSTKQAVNTIKQKTGTLAFVSYGDIQRYNLTSAFLLQSNGEWYQPSAENRLNSSQDHEGTEHEHVEGISGYPGLFFTYHLLRSLTPADMSCENAVEYFRFFEWFSKDPEAEAIAQSFGYVMLSDETYKKHLEEHILEHVTCNGQKLYGLHLAMKAEEIREKANYEFRKNLTISLSIIVIVLAGCYAAYRYHRSKTKDISVERFRLDTFKVSLHRDLDHDPDEILAHVRGSIDNIEVVLSEMFCRMNPVNYSTESQRANFIYLRELNFVNLATIAGFLSVDGWPMLAMTGVTQRSLHDLLDHAGKYLDMTTRTGIVRQIFEAVNYLHRYKIIHGLICPDVCLIDANYIIKLSDWIQISILKAEKEETEFYAKLESIYNQRTRPPSAISDSKIDEESLESHHSLNRFFYFLETSLLQSRSATYGNDLYSLAMTTAVMYVSVPFQTLMNDRFVDGVEPAGIFAHTLSMPPPLARFALACIEKGLTSRPTAETMIQSLTKQGVFTNGSIVDDLLTKLETYAKQLETKIEKGIETVKAMNRRMDELLSNMLPPSVAHQLSRGFPVPPKHFASASVMFTQVVEFGHLCALSTPVQIIRLLNNLFDMFDNTAAMYDVYKVETVADVYMTTSGVPVLNGNDHAAQLAALGCHLIDIAQSVSIGGLPPVVIKAGLASGPVMAGIIGLKTPRYCLFGNTVNVAARMETLSEPRRLQATTAAVELLRSDSNFCITKRGKLPVKGKGLMTTYWVRRSVGQFGPKDRTMSRLESSTPDPEVDIDV